MTTRHQILSSGRINFLKAQGYFNLSDAEISELAFGKIFAYIVCGTPIGIGVSIANIPTFIVMTTVDFF